MAQRRMSSRHTQPWPRWPSLLGVGVGLCGPGLFPSVAAAQESPALPAPELPKASELPKPSDARVLLQGAPLPDGTTLPDTRVPTDLSSVGDVALAAAGEEVQKLLPDPDKLADWFQGHGGAILGTGTQLVAPLGYVAGGRKNGFYRSHLPGLGLHGQIGMLFLRRFGATLHGAMVEHLAGTDAKERGSSWQAGASFLVLLKPEEKTPYLELGINRNSFSNTVSTAAGSADRHAASWDLRLGVGYMVLTKAQKFLYTPWAAVDVGRFSSIDQTVGGRDSTQELGDNRAWHYVFNFGITFAYHKKVPALMGPPPTSRPDDADGDLILDPKDRCAKDKEDYYPPDPGDGCPSTDWDQDKILNAADKCPTLAEDGLSPDPTDGCPTTDRDQDGVVDAQDLCQTLREDGQGDKPADGCPYQDRDGDGVLDSADKCPEKPETVNGFEDEDGCADVAPSVTVTEESITIRDKLFFEKGKADVGAVSLGTLDEIAQVLVTTPSVELVEIQGHADNVGNADLNRQITQARATAVRKALIARGVEPTRLTAVGYGQYCPLEPNLPDHGGNEKNRRVEFRILRTSAGPTGAATSCPEAVKVGIKGTDPKSKGAAK